MAALYLGVTRCPPAIVADGTTAVLSPEDRKAISAHMDRQLELQAEKSAWQRGGIDKMKRFGGGTNA